MSEKTTLIQAHIFIRDNYAEKIRLRECCVETTTGYKLVNVESDRVAGVPRFTFEFADKSKCTTHNEDLFVTWLTETPPATASATAEAGETSPIGGIMRKRVREGKGTATYAESLLNEVERLERECKRLASIVESDKHLLDEHADMCGHLSDICEVIGKHNLTGEQIVEGVRNELDAARKREASLREALERIDAYCSKDETFDDNYIALIAREALQAASDGNGEAEG